MAEQLSLLNKDPQASHYDVGGISVADVLRAKLTLSKLDGYSNSIIFNIVKYALRLPFKGQALRDARKIVHYAEMLCRALEERNSEVSQRDAERPAIDKDKLKEAEAIAMRDMGFAEDGSIQRSVSDV